MKKNLVFLMVGMLWATVVLAQGNGKSEYRKGQDLFNDKCRLCHGKLGNGDGPAAVAFNPRPKNFTDPKFWQNFSDAMIEDTIRNGHGSMPGFDLSPDQIKAIIFYMEHTFKK